MVSATSVFALVLLGASCTQAMSPVQKVIELLEEYKTKVVSDLAAEEKAMADYADFCDSETSEKGYEIKTAGTKITKLTAEIEDGDAQIASYNSDVASIGTQISEKEKQLDEAEVRRASEKEAFVKNEKELEESIDELEHAVMEIKKSSSGTDLIQTKRGHSKLKISKPTLKNVMSALSRIVDASWMNTADRHQVQNLMQTEASADDGEEDDLQLRAPQAAAFESASGGILMTMEEMQEKSEQALTDARNTEMRQQHNFDMMAQSLTDAMSSAKEKLADTRTAIATKTQENGENSAEVQETKKNKDAAGQYLRSLTMDCTEAREAWATRQEEAKAEIGALNKAKEILSSRVRVFVQVGAKDIGDDEDASPSEVRTRQAVEAKLKDLSHKFNSYALMEMVSAVASDPFEKIKGLIENMIAKLVEEANQEATQKAFCDEEISKSKASQGEKNMDLEKLRSRLDSAASKKADLQETVAEVQGEIADLDKATKEATALRSEEKSDYDKSSADFKDAAEAVEQAISVLKEYYEGASLVQVVGSTKQPTFGSKRSDAANTILSILEMCAEDFSKTYMELQQQEATAKRQYEKLMSESSISKAAKAAEVKGMESQIKSLEVAVKNHKEDLDTTTSELDAVMTYLEKLKPQCESKSMSYAEKKSRREAEMEGLKEALQLLEEPALLQTKAKPNLRAKTRA